MSVRATVWWLLATLTLLECVAATPTKRQKLPSIENGWPLSDERVGEGGDLVIQMPSCLAVKGVCAHRQNCQEEYIHETSDLCGEQTDTVCCLTRSAFEKHVLQLKSCADTGSVCVFEEDCPEQDRHSNPLLCGDQLGVTCCKTLPQNIPDPRVRRAHKVQLFSCEVHGGICRQEELCPEADRLGNSDMCGDQPYITCCQASDTNSHILTFENTKKRSKDEKAYDLKYKRRAHSEQIESCENQGGLCRHKDQCETEDRMGNSDLCGNLPDITCCQVTNQIRPSPYKRSTQQNEKRRAHSVQLESCKAQGGICKEKNKCPEESRLGTFDSCGDNSLIACCQVQSQSNEISAEKRSPELFPTVLQKKSVNIGPQRPNYLPATLCESKGGSCKQENQCPEQDRLGSSDMCADEPNVVCCIFSSKFPDHFEEKNKRRAHSAQIESCKAQGGICKEKNQCPEKSIIGTFDSCGDNSLIACCQMQSQLKEISAEKKSLEMFPTVLQKKSVNIGPQRPNHLSATLCESKGGSCKQENQCPEQDRLGSSDMCADEPNVVCCIFSSRSPDHFEEKNKRRAHSVQIESCKAQGGICKEKNQCPEKNIIGTFDSCGDNSLVACCQVQSQSNEISAEKRSPELFPSFHKKKSVNIGPQRPNHLSATLCESKGGSCKQENQCSEQDRLGSSDMCADEPNVVCCILSSDILNFEKIEKRRAHSVQLESCRAQSGMCTYVTNCPAEEQLGEAMCGGLANITCCHLPFLESAMSQDKQSADVVPEKKSSVNELDGKEKRGAVIPIQIKSCKAQGGVCKKKIECHEEDYIDASDICGNPYELIYTCCRVSNASVTKRRAHSVQLESCRAQGGMCRQIDQCPETDRLGSDSCGDLPYITCCKKSDDALSSGAEPRMIGNPSLNLECLMRGGLCKRNVDCFPEDRFTNTELCGSQAEVSCCKRLPPRVGECSERGGECVPESVCQHGPKDKFGQCSGGDVCCIWIT